MENNAPTLLISSLSTLKEKFVSLLKQARKNFKAATNVHQYISWDNRHDGIATLFAISLAYSDCMKEVSVQTRAELEQLWGQHFDDPKVRDAVESVLEEEKHFTEFISEVDKELQKHPFEDEIGANDPAFVGQILKSDLGLLNAASNQPIMLDKYWKESKFTLFILVRHFG